MPVELPELFLNVHINTWGLVTPVVITRLVAETVSARTLLSQLITQLMQGASRNYFIMLSAKTG